MVTIDVDMRLHPTTALLDDEGSNVDGSMMTIPDKNIVRGVGDQWRRDTHQVCALQHW
jgi:hypothetical protein